MIDIYRYNVGGNSGKFEEIYNRDLLDGDFSISNLSIKTRSNTTAITEAKINIRQTEYLADIKTDGNNQTITFLQNIPVTIFNVNELEDLDTRNYIYTFILTTSDLEIHNVHRNIIYTFNKYSDVGDVNGDGIINILDVVALADGVISNTCQDIEDGYPCDLTGDGKHSALDITTLANSILSGSINNG